MRKLYRFGGASYGGGPGLETLDVSDADARKKKHRVFFAPPSPPAYNIVVCGVDGSCPGTPGADVMVGASVREALLGGAGDDIYVSSAGGRDSYIDDSTSNDPYGGFYNGEFLEDDILDKGGVDMVDLSTSTSAYASTDFAFYKLDKDEDGAEDDLRIKEVNYGGDDDIFVNDHFGVGQMEYIKFSDTTLSGANLPLS